MNVKRYHVGLSDFLASKPIEAIKRIRPIFGMGLREAKEQIDAMMSTGKSMLMTESEREEMLLAGFFVMGSTQRTIAIFRKNDGNKLNAIKDLRGCLGSGLKETKDIMDKMWEYDRPIDIGIVNEYTVIQLKQKGFTVTGWIENHFDDDLFTV